MSPREKMKKYMVADQNGNMIWRNTGRRMSDSFLARAQVTDEEMDREKYLSQIRREQENCSVEEIFSFLAEM